MKEQWQNLVFPVLFLGAAGLLTVLVLWAGVAVRQAPPEPDPERFSRVEERLSRQELLLIEYFDVLPAEAGRLMLERNPFFARYDEEEEEEEPEEEEPEEEPEKEPEEEEEPDPPPPPRRIEIRYSGFLRGSGGGLQAYVVLDGAVVVGGEGTAVVDDWRIEAFDSNTLTLVDGSGETFEVTFNQSRVLEIPVEPEN